MRQGTRAEHDAPYRVVEAAKSNDRAAAGKRIKQMNKKKIIPKAANEFAWTIRPVHESPCPIPAAQILLRGIETHIGTTRSTSTVCRRLDQHSSKWPFVP